MDRGDSARRLAVLVSDVADGAWLLARLSARLRRRRDRPRVPACFGDITELVRPPALPCWLSPGGGAAAAEKSFSLAITGAASARYTGQCMLITGAGEETIELAGVVPRHEELTAEAIACRIQSVGSMTVAIAYDGSRSRSTISGGTAHLAAR